MKRVSGFSEKYPKRALLRRLSLEGADGGNRRGGGGEQDYAVGWGVTQSEGGTVK